LRVCSHKIKFFLLNFPAQCKIRELQTDENICP
jgi:hypothetical protein